MESVKNKAIHGTEGNPFKSITTSILNLKVKIFSSSVFMISLLQSFKQCFTGGGEQWSRASNYLDSTWYKMSKV